MRSWRGEFNEAELAIIDAASPTSIMGRMAKLLDGNDGRNRPRVKQFVEDSRPTQTSRNLSKDW